MNNENIEKFNHFADLIRKYGCMLNAAPHLGANRIFYRLKINQDYIADIKEKDLTLDISLADLKTREKYEIKFNRKKSYICSSQRITEEIYGKTYQENVENIFMKFEFSFANINYEKVLIDKIQSNFKTWFEVDLKGYSTTTWFAGEDLRKEEIYNKYKEKIIQFKNSRKIIDFIPNTLMDFKNNIISLKRVKEIIESSSFFAYQQRELKKYINYNFDLVIKNDQLYLKFKSLKKTGYNIL